MKIKDWKKFQHYTRRKPVWIKLYRSLLDDREWFQLDGDASKLLANCWLLASELDGSLPNLGDLAFRLRMEVEDIQELIPKLNHWIEYDASELLADCYQVASPERERERETETDSVVASATDAEGKFQHFWVTYPTRLGANPKAPAFKKWLSVVRGGVDPEKILNAAQAYRDQAKDQIGTPYIAQTVTWLNQRRWEDYSAPSATVVDEEEFVRLKAKYEAKQARTA